MVAMHDSYHERVHTREAEVEIAEAFLKGALFVSMLPLLAFAAILARSTWKNRQRDRERRELRRQVKANRKKWKGML